MKSFEEFLKESSFGDALKHVLKKRLKKAPGAVMRAAGSDKVPLIKHAVNFAGDVVKHSKKP